MVLVRWTQNLISNPFIIGRQESFKHLETCFDFLLVTYSLDSNQNSGDQMLTLSKSWFSEFHFSFLDTTIVFWTSMPCSMFVYGGTDSNSCFLENISVKFHESMTRECKLFGAQSFALT